jgi:hypothetical protein
MHTNSSDGISMNRPIAADVETIGRLGSVPTILQTVAHTTGMRFAAIARVTDTNWTACAASWCWNPPSATRSGSTMSR